MKRPEEDRYREKLELEEGLDLISIGLLGVIEKIDNRSGSKAVTSYELILRKFLASTNGQVSIEELTSFFESALNPRQQLAVAVSRLNKKIESVGVEIRKVQAYEIISISKKHSGDDVSDFIRLGVSKVIGKLESNPKHRAVSSFELILHAFLETSNDQVPMGNLLPIFEHTLNPEHQLAVSISKLKSKLARVGLEIRRVPAYEVVALHEDGE